MAALITKEHVRMYKRADVLSDLILNSTSSTSFGSSPYAALPITLANVVVMTLMMSRKVAPGGRDSCYFRPQHWCKVHGHMG